MSQDLQLTYVAHSYMLPDVHMLYVVEHDVKGLLGNVRCFLIFSLKKKRAAEGCMHSIQIHKKISSCSITGEIQIPSLCHHLQITLTALQLLIPYSNEEIGVNLSLFSSIVCRRKDAEETDQLLKTCEPLHKWRPASTCLDGLDTVFLWFLGETFPQCSFYLFSSKV